MVGILVVEDEAIVARDISNTLQTFGYEVIAVTDRGEEALELAGNPAVNLVLMDILLKGKLDGIEVATQIRDRYNIPVVFLTAHNDAATLERARVTIPYGYILKPFEERELQVNIEISLYRHAAEKRLKEQAAELERVKRFEALGNLAGGLAHELNNLLTIIMGHLELMETSLPLTPELKESARDSDEALKRARLLARHLLTFARGGGPEKTRLQLNQLIRNNLPLVQGDSKIQGHFNLAPDLWMVEADFNQLNQVMQNLLQVARQLMPGGGNLEITSENVNLPFGEEGLSLSPGPYVRVSVAEDGKAIAPEVMPKIFEPYGVESLEWKYGLDLAICYSIITRHGGHIQVKPEAGKGTSFQIYLPALNSESLSPVSNPAAPAPVSTAVSRRVLVMDDELAILNLLKRGLTGLGYEVTVAPEGSEAVRLYREAFEKGAPFQVVILDLTVPGGMGGVETLRHLKALDPGVKAIVSSGYSDDPVLSQFEGYGFKGRVGKPYLLSEMHQVLQKLISGE